MVNHVESNEDLRFGQDTNCARGYGRPANGFGAD